MAGRASQLDQAAAITRAAQAAPLASEFRQQAAVVAASEAFRGSRRSQDFLIYIVEQALSGHFDGLKERALGVDLFGRSPAYDTGEDAIVRVTASDVRRRLRQFYGQSPSDWRIDLPAGSYIPEFRHVEAPARAEIEPPAPASPASVGVRGRNRVWWLTGLVAVVLVCAGGSWLWMYRYQRAQPPAERLLPWSLLFQGNKDLRIILCDPDISMLQRLLDFQISLPDYANKQFVPDAVAKRAEAMPLAGLLRGVNVAAVDAGLAVSIAELAAQTGRHVKMQNARSLQMTDFKTDDNFILMGSPRSNPWFGLFEEALDFRFEFDAASKQEVVVNRRVAAGELVQYVPTAQGWGTGQAYAVIALIHNPGQSGHLLLLAGSSAEATEAAGRFALNPALMQQALRSRGIDARGAEPFEVLLKVGTMAGSSNTFEVVACHRLTRER